ncbi:glucosamine-6-phosphate deaminase [Peribacillus kribbensis]|uniref:glucosamine-6-phosphate deaminase n=1 Tax=Peribacillus kribbensis TaxID=356658 RepID=UPI0003F949A1|nr:glucosamine-6-phosphate deaminase [Peribacillus kribbensis]
MAVNYIETKSYDELSDRAVEKIIEQVQKKPDSLLCLAGGDTPIGTYERLVETAKSRKLDLSQCRFVGLDEWVGLGEESQGSCISYLNRLLFHPLDIQKEKIVFFDAKAKDLTSELTRVNEFIRSSGPIDLSLLGVGVNGHVGFNEPNASLENEAHIVELDDTTQEVGKKYFKGGSTTTQGITLGLKQLLDSKTVILIANGPSKSDAIEAFNKGEYNPAKPVTVLNNHPNTFAILNI